MCSLQIVHIMIFVFLGKTFYSHTCTLYNTGSPSSLYEPHKEHNMESNYKGLYGIFYKITMKVHVVKIIQ